MAFALSDFTVVIGPRDRVPEGCEKDWNMGRLRVLLPRRDGCSPRIEEPDLRVTGAGPK
jgi:hypothetical protein